MNQLTPRPFSAAFPLFALFLFVSGCLVVVEKDDDRRDRHRHLYAEWSLDVIVYRMETIPAGDSGLTVTFAEDGTFRARADCGSITGTFDVNDNDGFTVSGLDSDGACSTDEPALKLFARAMREARTYQADETELRIASSDGGMIGFSAR
jgi:hypothetical protein